MDTVHRCVIHIVYRCVFVDELIQNGSDKWRFVIKDGRRFAFVGTHLQGGTLKLKKRTRKKEENAVFKHNKNDPIGGRRLIDRIKPGAL